MPFPSGLVNLQLAGYRFDNDAKCKGCGASIQWWLTPKNAKMPLDKGTLVPHRWTCPKVEQFRKQKVESGRLFE